MSIISLKDIVALTGIISSVKEESKLYLTRLYQSNCVVMAIKSNSVREHKIEYVVY